MKTEHQTTQLLEEIRAQVKRTNEARRALISLSSEERSRVLHAMADALERRAEELLIANAEDLRRAELDELAPPLLRRLSLSQAKIEILVKGIRDLAEMDEPLGQVIQRRELSEELVLDQITTPIGTLLVIFESRPDSLPQIVALSIRSGNALVLKGGKEAELSNACLHKILTEAINQETRGAVSADVISLVTTRTEIAQLLELDELIDLVIPRGSNALVRSIQEKTKIPVLGHADGVCHVYIDKDADLNKAHRVVIDAKTDYPAACNAMETLLIHETLVASGEAITLLAALREASVKVLGGPRAIELGLVPIEDALSFKSSHTSEDLFHIEYGDLICTCEVVSDLESAIRHCNQHGSGHTESIITENVERAERFLHEVDSACVFHNASTRFADGFRFGLGAEVGISTSRIHARGPVGVEGLLSMKWILRSRRSSGHTVGEFSQSGGPRYTHRLIKAKV